MIVVDYRDPRPLYEQIVKRFADLILAGVLKEDEQLPSVRALAAELAVNPNTIQRAYAELDRLGYSYSVKGRGNFVSGGEQLKEQKRSEILSELNALFREARQNGISPEKLKTAVDLVYENGITGTAEGSEKA